MTCLTESLLLLTLALFVNADVCDKNFLVRIEDITKTNRELSEVNRMLNETVVEQQAVIENYTSVMEDLKATIQQLTEINQKSSMFRFFMVHC